MSKTVWIVDAAYLHHVGRINGRNIDYAKLKTELEEINGGLINESYYLNSSFDAVSEKQNGFYTWLKSAPPSGPKMRVRLYQVKDMHINCPSCNHHFNRQVQKGVDVGIATLLIKLAVQGVYERLILTAGDGDFEDAIDYIRTDLRKEFWLNGSQNTLSADLQCYADRVLWLDDMFAAIEKP